MKIKKIINLLMAGFFMISLSSLISCSSDDDDSSGPDNPDPVQQYDIYVAGSDLSGSKSKAVYWLNGQKNELTNGMENAYANSLLVVGNDVYVAGYEENSSGFSVAKYWKNGTAVELGDGSIDSYAYSIAVSGSKVYVGGMESGSGIEHGKVWQRGEGTSNYTFPEDQMRKVSSITMSNGDVYASGTRKIASFTGGVIWKLSGSVETFSNFDTLTEGTSIAVSGDYVYIGGTKDNKARYLRNGIINDMPTDADNNLITSLFVNGSDVYAAGTGLTTDSKLRAKYWKNGLLTNLSMGNNYGVATGIKVADNNIFVSTTEMTSSSSTAKYWFNSEEKNLGPGQATALFVVKK